MCGKFLLEIFLEKKKYKHKMISPMILVLLILLEYFVTCFLHEYLLLKSITVIILTSAAMYFLFYSRIGRILTLVTVYLGMGVICDGIIILLFSKVFPKLQSNFTESVGISSLLTIISRIVLLFLILIIKRKMGNHTEDMLTELEWLEFLIIPIITISSITVIIVKFNVMENPMQDDVLLYISLGMAVINVVALSLMNKIVKRERIIRNNRVQAEKIKNETEMYYSMSENLDKQRKFVHEFKNYISCMGELIRNEEYSELKKYYGKLDQELIVNTDIVDTNNIIVNAIINTKYREAAKQGIAFVLKVNDLSGIKLADMDIVTILSNLLNNAIESCVTCEKKMIKLKFVIEDEQTIISVKNSINHKPIKKGNSLLTSKTYMIEEHGFGIKNIVEVIEKYGGKYMYDYDENEFYFSIVF